MRGTGPGPLSDGPGGGYRPRMAEHHYVIVNRSQILFYRERVEPGYPPGCKLVASAEFPDAHRSYTDNESDMAGRFPGGVRAGNGMNIDERLPMQEEAERRNVASLANTIERFLRQFPNSLWDYAAGPTIHYAVLERLSPDVRASLDRALQKDLTKTPVNELAAHFDEAHANSRR
jgi:hypothetical protein